MFGGFASFIQPSAPDPPPKNVPPPTPVNFPDAGVEQSGWGKSKRPPSLVRHLQSLYRPADLQDDTFAALGVQVHTDVPAEDLIPDSSYLPSASGWDGMTVDEAREKDSTFQQSLSNGSLSPEARTYLDRRNELCIENQSAFRTVRRIKAAPGQKVVRLGNSYEFYRQLEQMAGFWDDTSLPPYVPSSEETQPKEDSAPSNSRSRPLDTELEQNKLATSSGGGEGAGSGSATQPTESKPTAVERVTYRNSSGEFMPPAVRHSLIAAFIKLVSYDFGCNVNTPRVEPRLQLQEPEDSANGHHDGLASYFASGCVFIFRIPSARDAARTGVLEGPVAAVSTRSNTNFASPADRKMDLARELVAALITAQHRAREGHTEKRFGQGKWWATAKRWGGGEGGPIGRELEGQADVVGDKDAPPSIVADKESRSLLSSGSQDGTQNSRPSALTMPEETPASSGLAMRGPPVAKKPRKGLSMYDAYRMVRLPSSNWDRKLRYEAVGKQNGASFDDIFVISSLFHHVSILRVRVPQHLLDVLAGGAEDQQQQERSWDKLEVWRSKWFDLFLIEDRLEALRTLWGSMAWLMRKTRTGPETNMGDDSGKKDGSEGDRNE